MRWCFIVALCAVVGSLAADNAGPIGYNKTTLGVAPTNLTFKAESITAKITNASIYSVTGILKGDGLGGSVAATPGVDYATSGSGSVFINGVSVSNPNFADSFYATWNVSGTNESLAIQNISDLEIASGAAINAAKIADGSVSSAEFQRLDGVTSAIQTQIDSKITSTALDSMSELESQVGGVNIITATEIDSQAELEALTGVSFATDAENALKANIASPTFTGTVTAPTAAIATLTAGTVTVTNSLTVLNATASKPARIGADQTITNGVITLSGSDVTGVLPSANIDSAQATDAEVTAAVAALSSVYQPLDSDLTALAGNSTSGLWARTGAGTGSARTITAGAGISISNGDGVSGNPTVTLAPETRVNNVTLWDGSQSSRTITYDLSGTDSVWTISSGIVDLTTGILKYGGNIVATAASKLSAFAATTSAELFGVISDETGSSSGTPLLVFNQNPTLARATITPAAADTTALTVNGGSVTGSGTTSLIDLSGTWNSSGSPTFIRGYVTNTGSGSSSLLMDLGVNTSTSEFSVSKAGVITVAQSANQNTPQLKGGADSTGIAFRGSGNNEIGIVLASGNWFNFVNSTASAFAASSDSVIGWSSVAGGTAWGGYPDTLFRRDAIATFQMGDDAATATNQKLKAHDGSGTDKVGANLTIAGGQGTGTGRGGDFIVQTAPSSTTGSSANSYTERAHFSAKAVALTEATATIIANIPIASSKFIGAKFICTVNASDGTDFQAITSEVSFSAVNKAGTIPSITVTQVDGTVNASSGTLTPVTYTAVVNSASVDLKCAATSSLTQTTLNCSWVMVAMNSDGAITVTPQ